MEKRKARPASVTGRPALGFTLHRGCPRLSSVRDYTGRMKL
jgi:hypothetical protein